MVLKWSDERINPSIYIDSIWRGIFGLFALDWHPKALKKSYFGHTFITGREGRTSLKLVFWVCQSALEK
jgi:hypothetical protein